MAKRRSIFHRQELQLVERGEGSGRGGLGAFFFVMFFFLPQMCFEGREMGGKRLITSCGGEGYTKAEYLGDAREECRHV